MAILLLQTMALTRDQAHDVIHCAAVLGWEKMLHVMVSMTTALVQSRLMPDVLADLANGFEAVAVLQGSLLCFPAEEQTALLLQLLHILV